MALTEEHRRCIPGHAHLQRGVQVLSQALHRTGVVGPDHVIENLWNAPNPWLSLSDALLYVAQDAEDSDPRLAQRLLKAALDLEAQQQWVDGKSEEVASEDEVETDPTRRLYGEMEQVLLERKISDGTTIEESLVEQAQNEGKAYVGKLYETAYRPFGEIIGELTASLEKNLTEKQRALGELIGKDGVRDDAEIRWVQADILAIGANLEVCRFLKTSDADFETYEEKAQDMLDTLASALSGSVAQSLALGMHDIDIENTRYTAVTSMLKQLKVACLKREAARAELEDDGAEGIRSLALVLRKKRLSSERNNRGIPLRNVIASQRYAHEFSIRHGVRTYDDFIELYRRYAQETAPMCVEADVATLVGMLDELFHVSGGSLDMRKLGFEDFFAQCYSPYPESDDPIEVAKEHLMMLLNSEHFLSYVEGFEVGKRYSAIGNELDRELEVSDYVAAATLSAYQVHLGSIRKDFGQVIKTRSLDENISHEQAEKIASVVAASHELRLRGNDDHLNEGAVLQSLIEAVFEGKPIDVTVIRCLRWCYPNRDVEIVPHGGDWDTCSADGTPIVRKSWVEQEKLSIYKRCVIDPLQAQGIPIGTIRLLCTGDYELTGPGYGLDEDDPRARDARAYVDDIRERVETWGLFEGHDVEVISLKELIKREMGGAEFQRYLDFVQSEYDQLSQDPHKNFLGYTNSSLERIIDIEHGHRTPFIAWWDRQRSRDFTRYITTFGLTMGVVLSHMRAQSPMILTVSGNQYAGRNFASGHRIRELATGERPPYAESVVGITLMNSVNDGDQSAHFRSMTQVVA